MRSFQTLKAITFAMRNLILGSSITSLKLLRQPKKMVGFVNESLFSYQAFTSKHGLPQKNVFEVLDAAEVQDIKLGHLKGKWSPYGDPWLHTVPSYTADIVSLSLLTQILKPQVIFEIGTLRGYTTLHFALNSPDAAHVYTLDLPTKSVVSPHLKMTSVDYWHVDHHTTIKHYDFQDTPVASKVTCLFGDSATFDYTPYIGKVDLFFIDGAHSYEYVRSDTLNALRCCHPGSVIAWHDFGRVGVNGVSKWLLELSKQHDIYAIPGGFVAFMVVK